MTQKVRIYAPNISKENLIALLYLQLSDSGKGIRLDLLKSPVKFRAPEMQAVFSENNPDIMASFIINLINISRSLGATRFVFKNENEKIFEASSNISDKNLKKAGTAVSHLEFQKIEIY